MVKKIPLISLCL